MIIIQPSRSVSAAVPARSAPRAARAAVRFTLIDGIACTAEEVSATSAAPEIAEGYTPLIADDAPTVERAVLERFLGDLATAPEIVGELVALYVEQYPRLAIWFAARALRACADAQAQIEAAAERRAAHGLTALADLIAGGLALALPPREPDPPPAPPVILDIAGLEMPGLLETDAP